METIIPGEAPKGAVLIIHSWWGLTDSFREYGRSLAEAGFLVGLADLFEGRTAKTESETRKLRARPRRVPMYKTLGADIETLRDITGSPKVRIGIVGFSMGGHWAVWLSQRPQYNVSATAIYYAARAGNFADCKANIIAHFAENDAWVSAKARKNMERAILIFGCGYEAFDYPRTQHWFAETERPEEFAYDAAKLALSRDLHHFHKHLKD